jgi:hypothetical protein
LFSKRTSLEIIPMHLFLKHLIFVEVSEVDSVFIVSSMTREKKAEISRASLDMGFWMSPDSSMKYFFLDMGIFIILL